MSTTSFRSLPLTTRVARLCADIEARGSLEVLNRRVHYKLKNIPDTYHHGQTINIDGVQNIADWQAMKNLPDHVILRELLKFILKIEVHELREQITYGGQPISNPHDIYEPELKLRWEGKGYEEKTPQLYLLGKKDD